MLSWGTQKGSKFRLRNPMAKFATLPAAFLDFNDIWDCYWKDICNIRYIYGLYMNKIFPIFSLIWFRNGFSKVQRGCNDIKIVYISNFSQFRSRGGVIENQFFPKFKKVQIILGGEGVKKIMDFFHKLWYFLFWTVPLVLFHVVWFSLNWISTFGLVFE